MRASSRRRDDAGLLGTRAVRCRPRRPLQFPTAALQVGGAQPTSVRTGPMMELTTVGPGHRRPTFVVRRTRQGAGLAGLAMTTMHRSVGIGTGVHDNCSQSISRA